MPLKVVRIKVGNECGSGSAHSEAIIRLIHELIQIQNILY